MGGWPRRNAFWLGALLGGIVFNIALQKGWLDRFPDSLLMALSFCVAALFIYGIWHHPDVRRFLFLLYNCSRAMLLIGLIFVGAFLGGTAGALGYWAIRKQNQREGQTASPKEDADKSAKHAPVVRVLYSSTQTIEISSAPGSYNETLNLDNVATMVQWWEWSLNEVGMLLVESPPVTIEKPVAGEGYKTDKDGHAVTFNPSNVPGIQIRQATVGMTGAKYVFNRFTSPSHIIETGGRKFRVTLQSIRDKSTKKKKFIAYTFGISEQ